MRYRNDYPGDGVQPSPRDRARWTDAYPRDFRGWGPQTPSEGYGPPYGEPYRGYAQNPQEEPGYTPHRVGAPPQDYGFDSRRNYAAEFEASEHDDDVHYRVWRGRRIQALDADYHAWREENRTRFDRDFESWRSKRGPGGVTGSANDASRVPDMNDD